jgi:diguanylate cyclase (GGDEF)-like protein
VLPSVLWLSASVLLAVAVLYVSLRTYRLFQSRVANARQDASQMSQLHLATIEALAAAIDAKDQTKHNHIRRVQIYATALARSLDVTEAELRAIQTAALLQDIGKLAVPEHILAKPGPLTAEELQKMRIHPQAGADIIANVPFPYPVSPLILSHHERWDGRGYPNGLKGEAIPLGARILCLADYFDALTSPRAYHPPVTVEAATRQLEQEAGHALDPRLVRTFLRVLPEALAQVERANLRPHRLVAPQGSEPGHQIGAPASRRKAKASVFDDIALAHREIYALYQISQTMGTSLGVSDTMALISSKLANLVPSSTCALFLHDEAADTLRCRFATGTDADILQQLQLPAGKGVTGRVAQDRQPVVNGRPSEDLEAAGSATSTALETALVCPLVFGERFIGTLAVYHTMPNVYDNDHRRLLDRVCEQAAAVIHNAILFEKTHLASLTDPLTGLPNTRSLYLHLSRELARAARLDGELSLLVMDLDGFKDINDTHGHHAGDRALKEVARALRETIRPYDFCIRYAGDEFIVVLDGCGRDEAEQKRVELCLAVAGISFEPRPGVRLRLSISAGAAVFPLDGDTYETLLARADGRMYRDKSLRKRQLDTASLVAAAEDASLL